MSAKLTNFAKMIDPAVTEVFNGNFKQAPRQSDKICSVQRAENYITEMGSNVNLSMAEYTEEQGSVKYEDFLQGDTKNLTQYRYTRGTKISKKLMKWNKRNQIKNLVAGAAQAIVRRKEFDITKLLERGFDTTYTHSVDGSTVIDLTGGDTKAIFSSSHATTRTATAQNNVLYDGKSLINVLCRLNEQLELKIKNPCY